MDRKTQYIYERRREEAKRYSEEKIKEIYQNYPVLEEIDRLISKYHIDIGRAKLLHTDVAAMEQELDNYRKKREQYLREKGLSKEDFEVKYFCPKCQDTGYREDSEGRYIPCSCLKEFTIKEIYENSNMRKRLEQESFERFDEKIFDDEILYPLLNGEVVTQRQNILAIKKSMQSFAKNIKEGEKSALFFGQVGLGKSYLSSCVAKEAMQSEKTVIYFSVRELIDCLECYVFRREEYIRRYRPITREMIFDSDLLIIDDLGSEIPNQFVQSELFHIINSRMERGKQMIISTNKNPLELRDIYGERIYSRLLMHFDLYEFIGENLRRRVSFS